MKCFSKFSAGFVLGYLKHGDEFELGDVCKPDLATISENREDNRNENSSPIYELEASDGIT